MATRTLDKFVRRYTTLSSALDTLVHQRLVLLSPAKWDDTNDVEFMELYRAHAEAKSVLALCFAMASETYHHWRVFTQGMEGVCIEFEKAGLETAVAGTAGVVGAPVEYLRVRDLEALTPADAHRLPFVKREGYSDEREWRIVATCRDEPKLSLPVGIDLGSITRLVLNPWMPPALADNLRVIIRGLPGSAKLKIEASALTNSDRWKAAGKKIAKPE
ncbi:hypothetical protein [Sphingomonas sp. MS122]|uniref:hypothetical protein n=1 Tax=Sphingomonas sp. MS122 TaxID=3412683 RepID=UPI003C303657